MGSLRWSHLIPDDPWPKMGFRPGSGQTRGFPLRPPMKEKGFEVSRARVRISAVPLAGDWGFLQIQLNLGNSTRKREEHQECPVRPPSQL
jgi:hypothetical protein